MRLNLVLALVVALGTVTALRPMLDNGISAVKAYRVISRLSDSADRTYDRHRTYLLAQAQAYNLDLGGKEAHTDNEHLGGSNGQTKDILSLAGTADAEQLLDYDQQLDDGETAILCWIEAQVIGLRQLVYHGTSDEVLAEGAGHLSWSSLPVGGSSSHCVIAAHSGMQQTEMFDELDKLEVGDYFTLHTLGDAYRYRIYQIETVTPDEAQNHCQIEPSKDLCTLMTCTPYGINTHRLLVHGERCAYESVNEQTEGLTLQAITTRRTGPALVLLVGWTLPVTLRRCASGLKRHRLASWRKRSRAKRRRRR